MAPKRPSSFNRFQNVSGDGGDDFQVFGTSGPVRSAGDSLSEFGRVSAINFDDDGDESSAIDDCIGSNDSNH